MIPDIDKARLLLATRAADLAAVRKVWPSAYAAASDALDALAVALAEVDRLTAALAAADANVVAWMAAYRATEIAPLDGNAADIIYRMEAAIERGEHHPKEAS